MKSDDIFKSLVDNAFDFLKKALDEFEHEPKYSAIHFYAAVELFLKARLLSEHWTLVLSKPEQADKKKFLRGDFQSVTLRQARDRLSLIIQDGITDEEFCCFCGIGDHRNRMVHFFHNAQLTEKTEIDAIVSEQCRAWYFLHHILSQRWSNVFKQYQKKISQANISMRKFRQYLKTRYTDLKGTIKEQSQNGIVFHKCPSCRYRTLKEDNNDPPLLEFNCLVCELHEYGITMNCPNCDKEISLIGEPFTTCKCGYKITFDILKELLGKEIVITKDNMYDPHEAHCQNCDGFHSVMPLKNGIWFCINCFSPFEDDEIECCQFCGDYSAGDLDDSYLNGCVVCKGKIGWEDDKE
jgi:hypothetical protein